MDILKADIRGDGAQGAGRAPRKVDVRLPVKGNSNSQGARPVHLIITIIEWIRTTRLSVKSLSEPDIRGDGAEGVQGQNLAVSKARIQGQNLAVSVLRVPSSQVLFTFVLQKAMTRWTS